MCGERTPKYVVCRTEKFSAGEKSLKAFTLIELLVVISIITLSMGILLPAIGKVKQQAQALIGTNNQHQIVRGVNLFATDNDDQYPESIATIGFGDHWNWQEPTMLTGYLKRSPKLYRSMSMYLHRYIEDASIMFCPNAPRKHKYLQQAWDTGEKWDNPDSPIVKSPLAGTYCFYWNYVALLGERRGFFRGPSSLSDGYGHSKLLLSCYFGYDHWRSRNVYSSCEKYRGAGLTGETWFSSAYWSGLNSNTSLDTLNLKLQAGYTDGHVGSYSPSEVIPMEVIMNRYTAEPYPSGVGPGIFYLPRNCLR